MMTNEDRFCAALCAVWVAAFWAQSVSLPDWDWRVFAAFLQAILSAVAIFSAYWLQERKRAAEKDDAQEALVTAFKVTSYTLEWWAAWLDDQARAGKVTETLLSRNVEHFGEEVDALRALPMHNIRDARRLLSAHLFAVSCRQFLTTLEEGLDAVKTKKIGPKAFEVRLTELIRRRERMLIAFDSKRPSDRLDKFENANRILAEIRAELAEST